MENLFCIVLYFVSLVVNLYTIINFINWAENNLPFKVVANYRDKIIFNVITEKKTVKEDVFLKPLNRQLRLYIQLPLCFITILFARVIYPYPPLMMSLSVCCVASAIHLSALHFSKRSFEVQKNYERHLLQEMNEHFNN